MTVPSIYVPSVGTLVGGPPALASTPLAPPALVSAPLASVPSVSPLSALLASAPSVSALPPLPMSLPDQVAEPSIMRTLHLADGVTVTFSASDVGPPPATTFASDIDLLNRMWDDTSKHWGHYSHLVIKNQYIPIVYWKQVYSRWPRSVSGVQNLWGSIKNQYSQWKVYPHYTLFDGGLMIYLLGHSFSLPPGDRRGILGRVHRREWEPNDLF